MCGVGWGGGWGGRRFPHIGIVIPTATNNNVVDLNYEGKCFVNRAPDLFFECCRYLN